MVSVTFKNVVIEDVIIPSITESFDDPTDAYYYITANNLRDNIDLIGAESDNIEDLFTLGRALFDNAEI